MDIKLLNKYCWEIVSQYMALNIHGAKVCTPYFMNNVEGFFVEIMKTSKISEKQIEVVRDLYKGRKVPYA